MLKYLRFANTVLLLCDPPDDGQRSRADMACSAEGAMGTRWPSAKADPYSTHTTCFETFSSPAGLTPADTAHQRTEAVDGGALIPADLPDALPDALPVDNSELKQALAPVHQAQTAIKTIPFRQAATAIAQAAQRLCNLRPVWLATAHAQLDAVVAAAPGLPGVGQRDAAIEWGLLDARGDWIEAFWEV